MKLICEHSGPECGTEMNGLWLYHSGIPHRILEGVLGSLRSGVEPRTAILQIQERFKSRGLPWTWIVGPKGLEQGLDSELIPAGMQQFESMPSMICRIEPGRAQGSPAEGVEIQLVESEAEVALCAQIVASAFGLTTEGAEFLCAPGRAAIRPTGYTLLIATLQGRPVGTGVLLLRHGVAGIYNVATAEPARRRGVCTSLIGHMMRMALREGYDFATLQASTMGQPLYSKLGFTELCEFLLFQEVQQQK